MRRRIASSCISKGVLPVEAFLRRQTQGMVLVFR